MQKSFYNFGRNSHDTLFIDTEQMDTRVTLKLLNKELQLSALTRTDTDVWRTDSVVRLTLKRRHSAMHSSDLWPLSETFVYEVYKLDVTPPEIIYKSSSKFAKLNLCIFKSGCSHTVLLNSSVSYLKQTASHFGQQISTWTQESNNDLSKDVRRFTA